MNSKTVIRKGRVDKDGKVGLFIRVTLSRKIAYYNTAIKIDPKHWDDVRDVVKKSLLGSVAINKALDQCKTSA
jgi:hypothetical protein